MTAIFYSQLNLNTVWSVNDGLSGNLRKPAAVGFRWVSIRFLVKEGWNYQKPAGNQLETRHGGFLEVSGQSVLTDHTVVNIYFSIYDAVHLPSKTKCFALIWNILLIKVELNLLVPKLVNAAVVWSKEPVTKTDSRFDPVMFRFPLEWLS